MVYYSSYDNTSIPIKKFYCHITAISIKKMYIIEFIVEIFFSEYVY